MPSGWVARVYWSDLMALKKLCKCGKVIDYKQKYCEQCSIKHKQERAEYYRYYDKHIRDRQSATFYNSPEWIKTRGYVLRKYKGLDLYAFFIEKKIVYADTVHHIEELKENWSRRLDIANLIPLAGSNHKRIHEMYKQGKEGTQRLLFSLLKKWEEEYGS